jgi:hypothetical protein
MVDRQVLVFEHWDRKQRERIRALVTDELVEEHARKPLGQHSDALERVLAAGAERARAIAAPTLADVREAMGVGPPQPSGG